MQNLLNTRRILALLSALLLGAFGSGIWDVLLKPSFLWIGRALLNVATLGIQSLVDNIYLEVAKGSYERAADATYQALMLMFGFGCLAFGVIALFVITDDRKRGSNSTAEAEERAQQWRKTVVFGALVFQSVALGCHNNQHVPAKLHHQSVQLS